MSDYTGLKQYYSKQRNNYLVVNWVDTGMTGYTLNEKKIDMSKPLKERAPASALKMHIETYGYKSLNNSPISQIKVVGNGY